METPSIAVVILNYNGRHYLEKFMPLVIQHSSESQIIVADNASTDDSVGFMQKNFPDIRLIILPKNYGFSGGYNQALKQVDADYYVLLNSDVEVSANWLLPVVDLMQTNPKIAAAQPKILAYVQKNSFEYAGAAGGFMDKYGYPFCRGRIFNHIEIDNGQYNQSGEVFWATGACLFIKSKAYWEVGGLDDDFFAHMEEIDLCWRLHHKGYKVMYCANSKVWHVGGGTLSQESPFKAYLNFRNSLTMLVKNLPKEKLVWTVFVRLCLDGVAALKFMKEGKTKFVFSIWKSHIYLYKNLLKTLEKRKKINPSPEPYKKLYPHSIVWKYFVNKKYFFHLFDM